MPITPEMVTITASTPDNLSSMPTMGAGPGGLFNGYLPGQLALVASNGFSYVLEESSDTIDGSTVLKVGDNPLFRWKTIGGGGGGGANANGHYLVTTATDAPINAVDMSTKGTGVLMQTVSGGVAAPTALNVPPGCIPFADPTASTGVLITSNDFRVTSTGTIRTMTIGDGVLAGTSRLVLNGNNNAQLFNSLTFENVGTLYASLGIGINNTAGTGSVFGTISITNVAGGSGNDRFNIQSVGQPTGPLCVMTASNDVGVGYWDNNPPASVNGFLYVNRSVSAPTGIPAKLGQLNSMRTRLPIQIDDGDDNGRWYYYSDTRAGWQYVAFNNYSPVPGRISYGGFPAGTTTDTGFFTFDDSSVSGTQMKMTIGSNSFPGGQGSLLINGNVGAIDIGGGGTASFVVTDPLGGGASNIACDDYFFGQRLIGYSNKVLQDLSVGVAAGKVLHLVYGADRVGSSTDALTIDGTSGAVEVLKALNIDSTLSLGSGTLAANGTVATVLGSLGPAGSHTTVQEWMKVKGSGGVDRWCPLF